MKKLIYILPFFLLLSLLAKADHSESLLDSANAAYSKGNFEAAIEDYKNVITGGFESSELYYNLGNAYYKAGDIPHAILYYEKSLKLNPGDEDAQHNLDFAKLQTVDQLEIVPELFFMRWLRGFQKLFSSKGWAILSIAFIALLFASLFIYRFTRSVSVKVSSFWAMVIFIVFFVISTVFATRQYNYETRMKEAIIFTPTLNVKSSPEESAGDIFVIHEGIKVKLLRNVGDWYEIKIADGSKGWVQRDSFKVI